MQPTAPFGNESTGFDALPPKFKGSVRKFLAKTVHIAPSTLGTVAQAHAVLKESRTAEEALFILKKLLDQIVSVPLVDRISVQRLRARATREEIKIKL